MRVSDIILLYSTMVVALAVVPGQPPFEQRPPLAASFAPAARLARPLPLAGDVGYQPCAAAYAGASQRVPSPVTLPFAPSRRRSFSWPAHDQTGITTLANQTENWEKMWCVCARVCETCVFVTHYICNTHPLPLFV